MMTEPRIQSFADFWPYYIGEHRNPVCRVLHFVGTGGFILILGVSLFFEPIRMGVCLVAGFLVAFLGRRIEAHRKAAGESVCIAVLWILGSPLVMLGIVWAYLCAWIGHFKVEGNRPATFKYPLWSLFGDFKMVGQMLCGRLWTGDTISEDVSI